MSTTPFEGWAIVEVMGHQVFAGLVSERLVAGQPFVQVEVPAVDEFHPAFTKMFGGASIYCITPCTEQVALLRAQSLKRSPINIYDLPPDVQRALATAKLPAPSASDRDEGDLFEEWDDNDDNIPM